MPKNGFLGTSSPIEATRSGSANTPALSPNNGQEGKNMNMESAAKQQPAAQNKTEIPELNMSMKKESELESQESVPCTRSAPLKFGVPYKAACCWAGSPWDLGFNVFDEIGVIDILGNLTLDKNWKPFPEPRVGDVCMAPFGGDADQADETRYRAKIIEASSSDIDATLLFLDYGNVAKVAKKDLRIMPKQYQEHTALARRLRLANVVPFNGLEWSLESKKYIETLIFEKTCEFTLHSLVDGPEEIYWGTLVHQGQDVGMSLLKNGLAKESTVQGVGGGVKKGVPESVEPLSSPPPPMTSPLPTPVQASGNPSRNMSMAPSSPEPLPNPRQNIGRQGHPNHGRDYRPEYPNTPAGHDSSQKYRGNEQPNIQYGNSHGANRNGQSNIQYGNSHGHGANRNGQPIIQYGNSAGANRNATTGPAHGRGQRNPNYSEANRNPGNSDHALAPNSGHGGIDTGVQPKMGPRHVGQASPGGVPYVRPLLPAEETPILPQMAKFKVVVAFVTSLNSFYVIKDEDVVKRRDLNHALSTMADFTMPPYLPSVHHSLVVAVRTEKYKWVRGVVLSLGEKDKLCSVRLLDYGEIVEASLRDLKHPPKYAFEVPPFAYYCSMDIVPSELLVKGEVVNGSAWDTRIVDRLRGLGKEDNLSGGRALIAWSLETNGEMNLIELKITGREQTWGKELVMAGLAECMFPDRTHRGTAALDRPKSTKSEEDSV